MYYGPGGSRLYSWLLKQKNSYRYLATALFLALSFIVWMNFLYKPLNNLIELELHNNVFAQEQLTNGVCAEKQCRKLDTKIKEHSKFLEKACDVSASQIYLSTLELLAQKTGIALKSCYVTDQFFQADDGSITLECKLHGTLQQLAAFFESLTLSEKCVGCKCLNLTEDVDDCFNISCQFEYACAWK